MTNEVGNEESGSTLRAKLEEALAREREMASELARYKAAELITQKGLKYVTPEDLAGVPLGELEDRASKLQEERQKVFELAIRRSFEAAGIAGDELEAQVKAFMEGQIQAPAQSAPDEFTDAMRRASQVAQMGGAPPARNPETMTSLEKIEAGLRQAQRR